MDTVLCTFLDIVLIISHTLSLQNIYQVYSLLPSSQSSYFYYSLPKYITVNIAEDPMVSF